jgi:hypothetical protein
VNRPFGKSADKLWCNSETLFCNIRGKTPRWVEISPDGSVMRIRRGENTLTSIPHWGLYNQSRGIAIKLWDSFRDLTIYEDRIIDMRNTIIQGGHRG